MPGPWAAGVDAGLENWLDLGPAGYPMTSPRWCQPLTITDPSTPWADPIGKSVSRTTCGSRLCDSLLDLFQSQALAGRKLAIRNYFLARKVA
eukprot:s15_g23.t1